MSTIRYDLSASIRCISCHLSFYVKNKRMNIQTDEWKDENYTPLSIMTSFLSCWLSICFAPLSVYLLEVGPGFVMCYFVSFLTRQQFCMG